MDQDLIENGLAEAGNGVISDGVARVIAAGWAEGMGPLQSLATTGAIVDGVADEISENYSREIARGLESSFRAELDALMVYVLDRGERGPVAGWSDLWG